MNSKLIHYVLLMDTIEHDKTFDSPNVYIAFYNVFKRFMGHVTVSIHISPSANQHSPLPASSEPFT